MLNLLTGIKTTTIDDLEQQKLRDLTEALEKRIEADPYSRSFEVPYVPEKYRQKGLGLEAQKDVERRNRLFQVLKELRERQEAQEARRR